MITWEKEKKGSEQYYRSHHSLRQLCFFESPTWYEKRELFVCTPFINHCTAVHSQTMIQTKPCQFY